MTTWSKERIREAYERFHKETGSIPTWKAISTRTPDIPQRPDYMPTHSTVHRYYGGHSNACVEIFGYCNTRGQHQDDDTREALREYQHGKTLAELGSERGITGQAMGRRLNRYIVMHDL